MGHTVQEIEIAASGGRQSSIRGRFILPESTTAKPPVIVLLSGDGPKGTKSLSWINLPPLLSKRGIASFLFDFSGLGYTDGDRAFLTVQSARRDFADAWQFVKKSTVVDAARLGIFASSFGATVALLSPDLANEAQALGLKSPASFLADAYINEVNEDELECWIINGHSDELGYDISVLKDALRSNVYESAEKIHVRTLITHGSSDTIVPLRQSKLLRLMLQGDARLEVFEGVGHQYSEEGAWDQMADLFVTWFAENL